MFVMLEHHPNDSRVKIDATGTRQALTQRMGTGGGNVPLVIAIHEADGQDVTMQEEIAYSLVTSGGKPGQGYPAALICDEDIYDERICGMERN